MTIATIILSVYPVVALAASTCVTTFLRVMTVVKPTQIARVSVAVKVFAPTSLCAVHQRNNWVIRAIKISNVSRDLIAMRVAAKSEL